MNSAHEEHKRHAFDSFCKKVLKNEARDHYDEMKRQRDRETVFSELSLQELSQLITVDAYPSDTSTFYVLGYPISLESSKMADAIEALSAEKRDIVLMSYFLDMNDKEIAKTLNMIRQTVHYKRTSSLKELKRRLEGKNDE